MAESREVYEITASALAELINSRGLGVVPSVTRALTSTSELVGKYLLVDCFAYFGGPIDQPYIFAVRDELTWRVWDTVDNENDLNRQGVISCVSECEVWYVVEDEPRARRVDEGFSIFVRVTVPDLSEYLPGEHPVYGYFYRWDGSHYVAYDGLSDKGASFYWAFETLTAWDVDTIVELRTRTNGVVEVLDREAYLKETGQSDAIR